MIANILISPFFLFCLIGDLYTNQTFHDMNTISVVMEFETNVVLFQTYSNIQTT